MGKKEFGIIGLGVMGKNLALNALDKNISLAVYNRITENEATFVSDFINENSSKDVIGCTVLCDFVAALATPRKILIMVKSGKAVDQVIDQLRPLLSENDVIIDGGNSHFKDSQRRLILLKSYGIHFYGLGVSGGEEGARNGPSLMLGGTKEMQEEITALLGRMAAKDIHGKPCCSYLGPEGAGHFVKMVHNGIEYADMQLLAELYGLLLETHSYEEIAAVFDDWNQGPLSSYLLEITAIIFKTKIDEEYVLDAILDTAGNKGTGSWSSSISLELGIPSTIKTAAVFARYTSSFKARRVRLSNQVHVTAAQQEKVDMTALKEAYDFARTLNLQQGLQLIQAASTDYDWNLKLLEICRVWTNGCIIKSAKIEAYVEKFKTVTCLLDDTDIVSTLSKQEPAIQKILRHALQHRKQVPCFYEAYNYWIAMTTARSTANLIQAQRDFFGAHTFQRLDSPDSESFHFNWS